MSIKIIKMPTYGNNRTYNHECPICGSGDITIPIPKYNDRRIEVTTCHNCGCRWESK